MTVLSKRPEHISIVSLILSVVFFGIAFFLGRWSSFFAVSAISWLILSSALIWLVLSVQFHQRSLAEQEKLDMGQLVKDEKASAIFQASGERADLFATAQRHLQILEKWFIPIFSILIAAYQIGLGLYLLRVVLKGFEEQTTQQPLLCAIGMTAIAFMSFLISRYATGMSAQTQWKPLRAGGSTLLSIAVLCFAIAIALALSQFKYFKMLTVINWIIPILLIFLGIETALNLIFDIYRPRLKGQYSRSAFDSRILGVINEPGGIFRSAASAIDYQFGFKVSQTWFYKLLEKAIAPLVLFAAITLYLLSCIVVVAPNEEAIIERFGNPKINANDVRHVGPGLHCKWPWPIDKAYKYPTKKVMEINIGFVPKPQDTEKFGYGPLLWGQQHYEEEEQLLVASHQTSSSTDDSAVPVGILVAAVPVQYRVKDLYSFIYNHNEPEKRLEAICYRELTKFAASAKIEVDNEADLEHSLLGAGRTEAKNTLIREIQKAADDAGLGVEIVFLGLQGIHPPSEVAADYQAVVGAVQEKQALIFKAQANRNESLSALAGSVTAADRLYSLALKYQQAEKTNNSEDIKKLAAELDTALEESKGDIFKTLKESESYAFEKATLAKAEGQRFENQLKAYLAAKDIYKQQIKLNALEESLKNIRKIVTVVDPNSLIIEVDFQEKLVPSIYDVSGFEENTQK
jgi:regulator of protease activity HflC (stomatin/prohibitin superfamily)